MKTNKNDWQSVHYFFKSLKPTSNYGLVYAWFNWILKTNHHYVQFVLFVQLIQISMTDKERFTTLSIWRVFLTIIYNGLIWAGFSWFLKTNQYYQQTLVIDQ
jgi:hypothetical protein